MDESWNNFEEHHRKSPHWLEQTVSRNMNVQDSDWDSPDSPVVKNPPCNAGALGSVPGWGTKIPQAAEQLNPCTTEHLHVPQLRPKAAK